MIGARVAPRVLAAAVVVAASTACGDEVTEEEARTECQEQRDAEDCPECGTCFDDAAYERCVDAYVECDGRLARVACPYEFICGSGETE